MKYPLGADTSAYHFMDHIIVRPLSDNRAGCEERICGTGAKAAWRHLLEVSAWRRILLHTILWIIL